MTQEASVEENRAVVARFYETVINQHLLDAIDTLLAEHFVHNGTPRGRAGQRAAIAELFLGIPDLHVTTLESIAENDLVSVRQLWEGTHAGPLMGAAPSGRHISFTSMAMLRVSGGLIAEAWVNEDDLGLLRQIGLLPDAEARG